MNFVGISIILFIRFSTTTTMFVEGCVSSFIFSTAGTVQDSLHNPEYSLYSLITNAIDNIFISRSFFHGQLRTTNTITTTESIPVQIPSNG